MSQVSGERGEVHKEFLWGDPGERDYFEEPRVGGMIILRLIFERWDGGWTTLIWLRIGTGGGLL
jgi:hypothetical protein